MGDPVPDPPRPDRLRPDQLDGDARALYDELTTGPRARGPQPFPITDSNGRLLGPFSAMLLNPAIGRPLQPLGAGLLFGGSLGARSREPAILLVAGRVPPARAGAVRNVRVTNGRLSAGPCLPNVALTDVNLRNVAPTTPTNGSRSAAATGVAGAPSTTLTEAASVIPSPLWRKVIR